MRPTDCDDANSNAHPGAPETCDLVDNDCDGFVDEGVQRSFHPDTDGDGYGDASATPRMACNPPDAMHVENGTDCDDGERAVSPVGIERCNGVDDDCDGSVDEGIDVATACPTVPGTTFACRGGACAVAACEAGAVDDCDGIASNGCEHDVGEDPGNCGACGRRCALLCEFAGCEVVTELAAGAAHTCALTSSGVVACWGANTTGELGIGSTSLRARPTRVASSDRFSTIWAGRAHPCAQSSAGLQCWGDNSGGQLGDGTTTMRTTPTPVVDLGVGGSFGMGDQHTCALSGSAAQCWGANGSGQLGDGTTTDRLTPAWVTGSFSFTGFAYPAIAAGRWHSCLVTGGEVRCTGGNGQGQLGNGTTTRSTTPVAVTGITDAIRIVAGQRHACALRAGFVVSCWGANGSGQLGDGTRVDRSVPVTVPGLRADLLATGWFHTCARRSLPSPGDEELVCWGEGGQGQLGTGSVRGVVTSPVAVLPL